MLLGVEKRRKEEEELESKTSLRSEPSEFDDGSKDLSFLVLVEQRRDFYASINIMLW